MTLRTRDTLLDTPDGSFREIFTFGCLMISDFFATNARDSLPSLSATIIYTRTQRRGETKSRGIPNTSEFLIPRNGPLPECVIANT